MRRAIGAYTLIELLLTIAVIGVLIGLLLPGIGAARGAARDALCLSNLKQISTAWTLYTNDFERFPWRDEEYSTRFGWGGVHWYGYDDHGNPILPTDEPSSNLLTARRPVNPYLGRDETTEAFARIFRCPRDHGVTIPAASDYGVEADPWADIGVGNASGEGDRTVFGKFGTSYQANDAMYSTDAKGHGEYHGRFGPKDVHVPHSDFVIAGDAGCMTIAETGLYQEVSVQGWWHGFGRGQLAFLDGSARHEEVIGETRGYTFYRTP